MDYLSEEARWCAGQKPAAKITEDDSYSIITDYLGTPVEMYNSKGEKTWQVEYDIYGKVRKLAKGSLEDCPFRYQGQYEDSETGLYYNRFRYYSADEGTYISQDPIGLDGGMANAYAYVRNSNSFVDIFGLTGVIYRRTDPFTGETYVGKSKSPESFKRRQSAHNSKLRKNNGMKGDGSVKYDFEVLDENVVGKDKLSFTEETRIRENGGIKSDGGVLENKIHGQSDANYKNAGGDLDKLGNKVKCN